MADNPALKVLVDDQAGNRTASTVVADALRQSILRGALPAGERLRQDAIAGHFGVSQMIVREAFKQLVAEDFLLAEPRRGVSVAPLSAHDAEEMSHLRSLLETSALRASIPKMRDVDFAKADDILNRLDRAKATDEIIFLNSRFHEALYAPAERKRTMSIITTLRLNFERYLRFTWEETPHLIRSQREHREILARCKARDVEKACELLKSHIEATASVMAGRLRLMEARD